MIKPIAIHLPQFHPFAENDDWWGKGFTEWTNVTKAKPWFPEHYQPHLPADMGFYDLRLEEARLAQIALAKAYGIHGFCYYHYWFNGKRLMEQPLDRMLANPKEDFPFMLCWANENWTRAWDGQDKEVIMKQEYNIEDDKAHIRFLFDNFFKDPRYIRVNNKIFFAVYKPIFFKNLKETTDVWRKIAKEEYGEELYLAYMDKDGFMNDQFDVCFDATIDFQPDFHDLSRGKMPSYLDRIIRKISGKKTVFFDNFVNDYKDFADKAFAKQKFNERTFPGITPMWDNSARRKAFAVIMHNSSPQLYGEWLQKILAKYKTVKADNKFVFINAWNEWAEGNHLEPCQKWGSQYLEVTKEKFDNQ